ncbi:hypothetical protein [Streptomyces sp. NPDC006012]
MRTPRRVPGTLAEVTGADVERFFAPPGDPELGLDGPKWGPEAPR